MVLSELPPSNPSALTISHLDFCFQGDATASNLGLTGCQSCFKPWCQPLQRRVCSSRSNTTVLRKVARSLRAHWSIIAWRMHLPWGYFAPMKWAWILPLVLFACTPIDQEIVGRFDRNAEAGCQSCAMRGPLWMEFDEPAPTGSAGRYRFQFEDEQRHSGTYQFLSLDTNVTLTLFPDSSTVLYSDLIGDVLYTEYTVRSGAVREPCEGLFRQCRWDRQP